MANIDIEKFIVSMIQQLMDGHPLKTNILYALLQQGLVYSDGRIVRVVNTKEGKSLEEAITNEPIITKESDIDKMVEKFKYNLQANNDMSIKYIPVEGIVSAYEKGLEHMFNKLKK